jgi:hypothetical protein
MVGMQDQDQVQRADESLVCLIRLGRYGEHHAQEIFGKAEFVIRVDEWLADGMLIAPGRNRGHLGYQAMG